MRKPEEIMETLLSGRGISSPEDISEFLSDRPQKTYDPFLLLNMEAGVDLLLSEINSGSRICIYGDYDADGVTSICILSHVIGMMTDNYTYYIPSRFEEGYGLNKAAVAAIRAEGADLLITVDCGSVSYEEVEYAKELGMKVIVTDHHSIDDVKADCILINPKQKDCQYPFKELAGCGVAFKLAQALSRRAGLKRQSVIGVMDLAAIGTVADVVSLTDENRTIVKYGLNSINQGDRTELELLKKAIPLDAVTAESIAFRIAPRINAAGRMARATEAVELFLAEETSKAEEQVQKLMGFNEERKRLQENAYGRCMKLVNGTENFILLQVDDIHEGIAGIVAGKIREATDRPVIIMTPTEDDSLKGTGRSVDSIDIYRLLKNHEELFTRFGGHKSACGFKMPKENLDALQHAIQSDMARMLESDPHLLAVETYWDMELDPGEITMELAERLELLEPCGQGNAKPVFMMDNVRLQYPRFIGEGDTSASFVAVSAAGGRTECRYFSRAQEMKELIFSGDTVRLVGRIKLDTWKRKKYVCFIVEEIKRCK